MLTNLLDNVYWRGYRYFQPIDSRFLGGRILSLRVPSNIESVDTRIKAGVARGLLWRHVKGYSHNFWTGIYDYEMQKSMKKLISPGDVFYDVGGNAGFHALVAAKLVGPSGRVFSFEPLSENIEMIEIQLAINDLPWCSLIPKGIAEDEGELEFFIADVNSMGSLVKSEGLNERSIKIKTTSLSLFAEDNPPPTAIKMDIEGGEGAALRGAKAMLRKGHQPVFFLEFHGENCVREVDEILSLFGYKYYTFKGKQISASAIHPLGQCIATTR